MAIEINIATYRMLCIGSRQWSEKRNDYEVSSFQHLKNKPIIESVSRGLIKKSLTNWQATSKQTMLEIDNVTCHLSLDTTRLPVANCMASTLRLCC